MWRLSFIFLTLSFQTWAYGPKDINLSDYEFNRYVRPQLISITQDYYTLIISLNPELKPYKQVSKNLYSLYLSSKELKKYKNHNNSEKPLKILKSMLKKLNTTLKSINDPPNNNNKKYFTAENIVESMNTHSYFMQSFLTLYQNIQNSYFLKSANIKGAISFHDLRRKINNVHNDYQSFILASTDNRFRTEFMSFWSDFIKPVNTLILPKNDKKLFISKLNDLNLRLNILNMILTKRNKKIPPQTKTLLKIIHNRWNNILKVTLRR